jgi:3-oxoacyl-[acyl-carrier protein] reductase
LERHTALITGSATGLGKKTAIELAKQGVNVILNSVTSLGKANELKDFIENNYPVQAIVIQGDISTYSECERIVSSANDRMGGINILINNAGAYIVERKDMVNYDLHEWEKVIQVNLTSVFYLAKLVMPTMRQNRWGRIINMGFDRAETAPGWRYRSAFAAAKTGLVSLTKTLAIEESENRITVNMVCPGDITGDFKEVNIKEVREVADNYTPIGRPGTGEDIARVIAFLCHRDSDFITGSVIAVTGGKDVLTKYRYQS